MGEEPLYAGRREQRIARSFDHNLSTEPGTCKTVKARFRPWRQGGSLKNVTSCSVFSKLFRLQGGENSSSRVVLIVSERANGVSQSMRQI